MWAEELRDDARASTAVDMKVESIPYELVEEYRSARHAAEQEAKKAQEKQIGFSK